MSHPSLIRRLVGGLAGAAALAALAPAAASACTPSTSGGREVFSAFGDTNSYVLAPGGSFESGAPGWTLSNASVVSGNESDYLNSRSDSHSLQIRPGGTAISAPFCVSSGVPTFRFVARQSSGSWAEMNVSVLWTNSAGQTQVSSAGGLSPSTGWNPTQAYDLGEMLPTENGQTYSVRIEFTPAVGGGAVSIDDVFVDPFNRA